MNWKHFLRAFISAAIISFPYNIIGCAGEYYNPYDYFVSFFHHKMAQENRYDQFHYTSHQFLYDHNESTDAAAATSAEWAGYCNNAFNSNAAYQFVCKYAWKDLNNLYFHLEKKQPLKIPDSVKKNGFTQYLMKNPDLEALGYIMYAKQVEPQVTGSWAEWEPINRDKPKMDKLIKNGQQLYKVAKKDFIKLRYAYQLLRLAHYSGRYSDCKNWYNEMIAANTTPGVIQDLALGLKAGAMMRLGEEKAAAAIFSRLFSASALKRVSNYMSFDWCVKRFDEQNRRACMRECKNDAEKANMLGLFLLGEHTPTSVAAVKQVYELSPNAPLLEMLVTREVHKMEEYYFSKNIDRNRPKSFDIYYNYNDEGGTDFYAEAAKQGPALISLCQEIAGNNATKNKGLYQLAAAHTALIMQDYGKCSQLLDAAKGNATGKLKDQWEMTRLLHAVNSAGNVDAALENTVAAALPWLEQKAAADEEYAKFIRRLFADVLAVRYANQNNMHKYALSMGVADALQERFIKNGWGFWDRSLSILRSKLTGQQVEDLVKLMENPGNSLEKYMVRSSKFTKDDVNDVAGTAFMRELNWNKALQWYKKIPAAYYNSETYKTWLAANPFADLMLDVHTKTKWDTKRYTKPEFAQKMGDLLAAQSQSGETGAKAHYEYATGLYNMSYYGNSWMMVEYGWSSYTPALDSPAKMNSFEKWYYTANNAEAHYKKAATLSGNKELKARSLYMAAKCAQKNHPGIPWTFADNYRAEFRKWLNGFAGQYDYFPRLKKEYGQTAFYKEAVNTCSYFRDFVSGKP